MEDYKGSGTQQGSPPTGVFDIPINTQTKPMDKVVPSDTGVFPTVGTTPKNISEKTLKKRLARLAASRPVLLLAVLLTVSAVLTALRGYFWPVTVTLTAGRALAALAVWLIYGSAGKKGSSLLAALPLYMTIVSCGVYVLLGVFVFCAMFGKMFLLSGDTAVDLVRSAHSAGLWAVPSALAFFMAAYCLYLFKRHERLLCCNIRDGIKYGFPFEKGSGAFMRCCVIAAVVLPVLHIGRGVIGSFTGFEVLGKAAAFYDKLFIDQLNYWLSFVGILVHSAALIMAGAVGNRYSAVVKRYKAQRGIGTDDKTKTVQRDGVNGSKATEKTSK